MINFDRSYNYIMTSLLRHRHHRIIIRFIIIRKESRKSSYLQVPHPAPHQPHHQARFQRLFGFMI